MQKAFFPEGKEKILVVEDSPVDRALLVSKLNSWNYSVLSGQNGEEGMELFKAHAPKIVITDLTMPNLDGFSLIKSIRETELSYTYLIVLSGVDDKKSIVRALSSGADDYLTKPFHPEELRIRLLGAQRLMNLESQDMLIFALAKLAEYRSNETGQHLERVQHYTLALAQELAGHGFSRLTSAVIEMLFSLSSLHDIGKVAIPDNILHKPGRLTSEEFEVMKQHTVIGGNLLEQLYKKSGSVRLKMAKHIVLYHHERFDGTGYPYGLKGEEIPLEARIVALADMFDALSTERCYKPAFAREKCREIIEQEKGNCLDPALVEAFLRQEKEFWEIRKRFPN
ncbi:response regulator [Desulfohalobiaceae bacterium Ax17]|jgi:putative two-component system response regulator|uniref:HD domain-containing phosphohydrolase n=1 Tax=Desulfovulcanus ferrireducens TaxID=2831190 RepID=UPI00207BB77F|nr:HD domain-containing phosphohydrolase [Desulfovulcanus ferrireducens]MBT8764451.1 response regulator [Desulfovulcanus ferrireducens]